MIALVVVILVVVEPTETDCDNRYADNYNDFVAFNLRDLRGKDDEFPGAVPTSNVPLEAQAVAMKG